MIYKAKRGKAEFALRTLTFRLTITLEPAPNICYLNALGMKQMCPALGRCCRQRYI